MSIPGSDPERKRYYFTGIRHFRGRFGSRPIDLTDLASFNDIRDTSAAQVAAYRDPRRVARLFRPPLDDRTPLAIEMDGAAEESRSYTPHADDAHLLYFETSRRVKGAKWLSIDWTEDLPDNTDIIVLARVGDGPAWGSTEPVDWDAVSADNGSTIYKFTNPKEEEDDNAIDARGDTITVRVFFKFNPGYDIDACRAPLLKSITVTYEAGPRIIESEVLSY
jgi:hypothetical protein